MIRARVTTTCLSRRPAIFLPRPTLDQAGKRFCEIGTKHFVEMSRGNKREIDRAKTQAKLAANQKATKVSWELGVVWECVFYIEHNAFWSIYFVAESYKRFSNTGLFFLLLLEFFV
jgi:4F5 protein related disordered region